LIYAALALVFSIIHHIWVINVRSRVSKYMAAHISNLRESWGYHIQNWIVRVFLPVAIVLSQGIGPGILGFRVPKLNTEILLILVLLTVALFLVETMVLWSAISLAKDAKVIEAVKDWPTEWHLKDSIIDTLRWTIPEECFLRGYLISQLAIVGMIPALLVSTFFTAVMHESRGKFWILLSVFTGLFFGLAFILTDSLLPSFLMHAIGNDLFPRIQESWAARMIERVSLPERSNT
jgi:membrane protease YdiL (CAAX protease family)